MAAKNAVSQGTVKDAVARFRVKRREMFKELLHKKRERERERLVSSFSSHIWPNEKTIGYAGEYPCWNVFEMISTKTQIFIFWISRFQIYWTLRGIEIGESDPALPGPRHPVHPWSRAGRPERLRRNGSHPDGRQRGADPLAETDVHPAGPDRHLQHSPALHDDVGAGSDAGHWNGAGPTAAARQLESGPSDHGQTWPGLCFHRRHLCRKRNRGTFILIPSCVCNVAKTKPFIDVTIGFYFFLLAGWTHLVNSFLYFYSIAIFRCWRPHWRAVSACRPPNWRPIRSCRWARTLPDRPSARWSKLSRWSICDLCGLTSSGLWLPSALRQTSFKNSKRYVWTLHISSDHLTFNQNQLAPVVNRTERKKEKTIITTMSMFNVWFFYFCVSFCSAEVWPSSSTFCATHAARRILKRNPKLPDSWLKSHLLGWTPRWKMPKPESFVAPATAAATEEISSSQIPTAHGRRSIWRLTFRPSLRPWLVSEVKWKFWVIWCWWDVPLFWDCDGLHQPLPPPFILLFPCD